MKISAFIFHKLPCNFLISVKVIAHNITENAKAYLQKLSVEFILFLSRKSNVCKNKITLFIIKQLK